MLAAVMVITIIPKTPDMIFAIPSFSSLSTGAMSGFSYSGMLLADFKTTSTPCVDAIKRESQCQTGCL